MFNLQQSGTDSDRVGVLLSVVQQLSGCLQCARHITTVSRNRVPSLMNSQDIGKCHKREPQGAKKRVRWGCREEGGSWVEQEAAQEAFQVEDTACALVLPLESALARGRTERKTEWWRVKSRQGTLGKE